MPVKIFLKFVCDEKYPQYFDKNIISCTRDEIFVDCGSFTGDTAEEFIRQFGNYKHIYAYEPVQDNIQICHNNPNKYMNITLRQCGVGEKNAIAITKIDEYLDATDHGRCGLASEISDVSGFANILLKLYQDCNLDKMCQHAYKCAQKNFNMEKIVAKLNYLIFW